MSEKTAYPPTWSAQVAATEGKCPLIAGTYSNEGISAIPEGSPDWNRKVYLSQVLRFSRDPNNLQEKMTKNEEGVAKVRFDQRDAGELKVELVGVDGKVIRAFAYSQKAGDYTCGSEGLERSSAVHLEATLYPGPVSGFLKDTIHLRTNTRGDVVVTLAVGGVGFVFFVIPVGLDMRMYVMFPKLVEE